MHKHLFIIPFLRHESAVPAHEKIGERIPVLFVARSAHPALPNFPEAACDPPDRAQIPQSVSGEPAPRFQKRPYTM